MDDPYKTVINGSTLEVTSDHGWHNGCGRLPHTDLRIERCFVLVSIPGETPRAVYYGSFSGCISTKEFLVSLMKSGSK